MILAALLLSSCAGPKSPPSPVPLWSRVGTTINHEIGLAAELGSAHFQTTAIVTIVTPWGKVDIGPVTWRAPVALPAK